MLRELLAIAESKNLGHGINIKLLFAIISGLFDYNVKISDCMNYEVWHE